MTPRDHDRVAEAFRRPGVRTGDGASPPDDDGAFSAPLRLHLRALLEADARNADGFLETPAFGPAFHAEAAIREAAAGADDEHPDEIGPYRVLSVLHDGDLAAVYLAERDGPETRRAAVKLLRSRAPRREIVRRFELERRAIALMDHPNVARLFDAGATPDGRAWFAMEYVPGEAVTAFATRGGLALPARLRLFIQACLGVEHAHRRGIIHRDLKPSNVMAARADSGGGSQTQNTAFGGPDPVVKVIDFGVAKLIRAGLHADGTMTGVGRVLGTIAYMSPEQLAGDARRIDTRTDVYGLGALLYELVAGRPAFGGDDADPASVVRAVLHEPPAPIRELPRDLGGDIRAIVEHALEKDPDRRYPSVAELRADVERMLAGLPVGARRRRPLYLARKFIRRHRVWTAAAAIALAGIAWGGWQAWSAQQERHRLAMDLAGAWFDQTLDMARSVGERARRRPLLARLDGDSERLAAMAPRDPAVLDMRADVLKARGDLELEEGWTRRAQDLFARSLAIREALARHDPADMNAALDLSIAMVRVGDTVNDEGRSDEALVWYQRALAVDEAVAARFPTEPRVLTTLIWSMDRMGVRSQPEARRACHARQLALAERLNALVDGVDERRAVSTAHAHLASIAVSESRLADAVNHAENAVAFGQGAVALNPDNRYAQHTLIGALLSRSSVYAAAGGRDDALADALGAAYAAQRVADADPDEVNAAWQLAGTLGNAAAKAEAAGNLPIAVTYARRNADQAAHLARLHPTNPGSRDALAGAETTLRRLESAAAKNARK